MPRRQSARTSSLPLSLAHKDVNVEYFETVHRSELIGRSHAQMSWVEHKRPAVEGALSVHRAALSAGINHIVHLSSFAAMCDFLAPLGEQDGRVYDEQSWNPITDDVAERLEEILPVDKHRAIGGIRYGASKMFSEKAVWDLHGVSARGGRERAEGKEEGRCKLTVLCPPSKPIPLCLSHRGVAAAEAQPCSDRHSTRSHLRANKASPYPASPHCYLVQTPLYRATSSFSMSTCATLQMPF